MGAPVAATVLVKCLEIQPLQVEPWIAPGPLDVCLECRRAWMKRNNQDLGTHRQALRTNDDDKDVRNIARASPRRSRSAGRPRLHRLQATINELRVCDRWAIDKMCSVSRQFAPLDVMQTVQGANKQIEQMLRDNIAMNAVRIDV